ncbi:MAG: M20/M25/M40 family metallo-hydrolase [Pirellulales bacterium]
MPPNSCVELLAAMVGFDSVTPRTSGRAEAERPLAEYVFAVATAWGFHCRWLPVKGCAPNLLIEHTANPEAPWLLFDSHLDTVGIAGMTIDPFAATIRDGRLYGRGACDTKGTGAAMLWALREYARNVPPPPYSGEGLGEGAKQASPSPQASAIGGQRAANVAILFSVGEEDQQIGARTFVDEHLPMLSWRPAAIVVGEPTRMQLVAGTNGFVRWQIRTRGRAAHSSAPSQGRNAISDMARVIAAIEDRYIAPLAIAHPLTGKAACCITRIHGGTQVNVVPETCAIDIDRRVAPGEDLATIVPAVDRLLGALRAADPELTITHEAVETAPPLDPEPNLPLAESCVATLRSVGIESLITGAPYTTNANHYGAAGLATIILGPGDIAQAHTAQEWIELEELRRGVKGYLATMNDQR